MALSTATILSFGSVTSTMDVARHLFLGSAKQAAPFVVIAKEQLSGRGRLSSDWHSPAGNLYTTIVLQPDLEPKLMALSSFAVVLALYDCIKANSEAEIDLKVKWPNDLLLKGQKIAGLLLEALPNRGLLIGLGLNLKSSPHLDGKAYKATDLSTFINLAPKEFLSAYLHHLEFWMNSLEQHGFVELRQTWLNRAYGIGKKARIRLPNEEIEGTLQGIDQYGQLLVSVPVSGNKCIETRSIAAGSVFF